jgi:hypothetical protein
MNKSNLPKYKYTNKFSSKYGVKFNDPNYLKIKNKTSYENTKSTLINYYKKKYGGEIVEQLIETFGYETALDKLRNYKSKDNKTVENTKSNKSALICYYKKKYGDIAIELIESFGLELGLEKLRNYKSQDKPIVDIKTKQKEYYNENKTPLINYYKKKYGDIVVLELISDFGLDEALEKLRNYKNNLPKYDDNPFQNLLIV